MQERFSLFESLTKFLKHEMTLTLLEEFCFCRWLLHFPGFTICTKLFVQIIFCCPHLLQLITITGVYIWFHLTLSLPRPDTSEVDWMRALFTGDGQHYVLLHCSDISIFFKGCHVLLSTVTPLQCSRKQKGL